ncbi:GDP-mannose 4,6-dehydratase [Cellulosimicrobium cellulans]|uniref:GDP-mannose 4,6-dehydratase n=1 Tax=Cellulosimicrobium cellulans TaxID=1710 RepID=UPI00130E2CE1|nr:GDP-mannose 4,6-dehydratase [Cellulosimicrobium cellulans]
MARVLITGVTGQDGSYLAERLVAEGAEVHGLVRASDASASDARARGVVLHEGDLGDEDGLRRLVDEVEPDEVYNLAGISSVAQSWREPVLTGRLSGLAVTVLLDAAARLQDRTGRRVAFVQASSSEIFGDAAVSPQDESTPVRPVSPYGAAKAFAHHAAAVYRGRGLHAATCILFNHESPRRPTTFVTRKITSAAARIAREGSGTIRLGNLEARRDWGWAPDYVDAMVRAARHDVPDDFVVATGTTHTVAQFAEAALRRAGVGDDWAAHVESDPEFFRPADASVMVGDAGKARRELGWTPSVTFEEVVGRMVDHDLELGEREAGA